jgi:DNA-binding GntR family transcriptional regulator
MQPQQTFQTKEEYAYQMIRQAILSCEFKPDEKLVIDHLGIQLGISQIPIRAAMQRLQAEGLVQIIPHSGAVVSPIQPEKVEEIFSLLEVLEQTAFRHVAEKITQEDLFSLQALVNKLDTAAEQGNIKLWAGLNIQFHRQIAEFSGMPLLLEFTHRILDEWQRLSNCYFQQLPPLRLLAAQAEHHQIIFALKNKDVEQLQKIAVTHNRQAVQAYQKLLPALRQAE